MLLASVPVRYVVHGTTLRALVTSVAVGNFIFRGYPAVVLVVYARQLGLPAGGIGLIVAVAGIGGIAGSLAAGPLARRLGALVGGAIGSATSPRIVLFAMLACCVTVPVLRWRSPISRSRTLADLATPVASTAPATV
jgi:MFS family permease